MLLGESKTRNCAVMVLVVGRSMQGKCELIFTSDAFALVVDWRVGLFWGVHIYFIVLGLSVQHCCAE